MHLTPYVFFDGRCEEALEFYQAALGAKVTAMLRFKEAPDQSQIKPESREKVMHSAFTVGDTEVFASDGYCLGQPAFQGFGLALSVKDIAEVEKLFAALSEGGQVQMPLAETFFAARFGTVADKFGVTWMLLAHN